MTDLAVSIIAHNEADDLESCLGSVKGLAAEVVVVDCASSDSTAKVARRAGARLFRRPNLMNLNVNKAFGVSRVRAPWVLYIDPDERVPPALRREILGVIASPGAAEAYEMPRRNFYFGRWLRHGGKYPDWQRRLFRRGMARFPARHVHEKLAVRGRIARLASPLDHHPYPDLEAYFRKLVFYARFQARYLSRRGGKAGVSTAVKYLWWLPASRFLRRYFLRGGFLDGVPGLLACVHDALTHMLTYVHLRERQRPGAS